MAHHFTYVQLKTLRGRRRKEVEYHLKRGVNQFIKLDSKRSTLIGFRRCALRSGFVFFQPNRRRINNNQLVNVKEQQSICFTQKESGIGPAPSPPLTNACFKPSQQSGLVMKLGKTTKKIIMPLCFMLCAGSR